MINDLLELVQRELGQPLPGTSRILIQATLAERYGGTRIYVPMLPKAKVSAAIVQGRTPLVGERQVRRVQRGR